MKNQYKKALAYAMFVLTFASIGFAQPLLDADEVGFGEDTRSNNYDTLLESYFSSSNVITTINDEFMWVPWYKTSSDSKESDLQDGNNCNSGENIDFSNNCMVTDEFSQVGILVAMGKNQERMDQFYNTVRATKSTFGDIPSWRIYRNGDSIEPCREGINSNCDTASDATARIVISLFAASKNPEFTDEAQKQKYADLAVKLSEDMLEYEIDNTCRDTYYGKVCYWLAGGSNVKQAGITAGDYAYTGYYPDAIIAMLQAYANTKDERFLQASKDITLNYMQAARFDGSGLRVPPGKSFRWVIDSSGFPQAECTNTCSPIIWDSYDASRALGMCQAKYYADEMGVTLPLMDKYCQILSDQYMSDPNSAPLQFKPDGSPGYSQSGYYAQGLQSLHQMGSDPEMFKATLDNALAHYNPSTQTFDSAPSMGVYTSAFAVRALGVGIGRDLPSFSMDDAPVEVVDTVDQTPDQVQDPVVEQPVVEDPIVEQPTVDGTPVEDGQVIDSSDQSTKTVGIADLTATSTYGNQGRTSQKTRDLTLGACRELDFETNRGIIEIFSCEKSEEYIEIYVRSAPKNLEFEVCIANGCVSKDNGFARFIPEVQGQAENDPVVDNQDQEPADQTDSSTTEKEPEGTARTLETLSHELTFGSGDVSISLTSDVMAGQCREIIYDTSLGRIKALACEKGARSVEVYRQEYPADVDFKFCLEDACLDKYAGFAKLTI